MSNLITEYTMPSQQHIQVRMGDLTLEKVDAIVNAANCHLVHGGGVAGAIVRAGGDIIQEECDRWVSKYGPVPTGHAVVTTAGKLDCKAVIHTAGPIWQGGGENEDAFLRQAVWNSLMKAEELQLTSISIPAISSGIYGFPKQRCASISVKTAVDFCTQHPESALREIRFTNIDQPTVDLFKAEMNRLRQGG